MKLDSYALAEATVLSLKMPLILMVFRKIIRKFEVKFSLFYFATFFIKLC